MGWIDIREPRTRKLLFRYDPQRDIIEIQQRNIKTVVDLRQFKAPESAEESDGERQQH
jgi:hypothetical protein